MAKSRKQKPEPTLVSTVKKMENTEWATIQYMKMEEYMEERQNLQIQTIKINKRSRTYKLGPTLTAESLLSTVQHRNDLPQPVILPRDCHVSALVVQHITIHPASPAGSILWLRSNAGIENLDYVPWSDECWANAAGVTVYSPALRPSRWQIYHMRWFTQIIHHSSTSELTVLDHS